VERLPTGEDSPLMRVRCVVSISTCILLIL
jgi:hypothetical protein